MRPPADPYDVPASPQRATRRNATDSPYTRRSLSAAPTRDSRRDNDTTVTAASSAPPERREVQNGTISSKKTDTPDRQTPKKKIEEAKPAAAEGSSSAAAAENVATPSKGDGGEVEIDHFESHRIDEANATVDILVVWVTGEQTWEAEWSLQNQVPTLVFQYWDKLEGREVATGLDVYHVFRILKRATPPKAKKNRYMYQVQWVGYRRTDATWEHEDKVKEIAPDELIKFEAKYGAAPDAPPQKRVGGRGPGRPKKKVKTDDAE